MHLHNFERRTTHYKLVQQGDSSVGIRYFCNKGIPGTNGALTRLKWCEHSQSLKKKPTKNKYGVKATQVV